MGRTIKSFGQILQQKTLLDDHYRFCYLKDHFLEIIALQKISITRINDLISLIFADVSSLVRSRREADAPLQNYSLHVGCTRLKIIILNYMTVGFCIETPWRWGVFLWYNCGVTDWRIYEVL